MRAVADLRVILALVSAIFIVGCETGGRSSRAPAADRCGHCGMFVEASSGFAAGASNEAGQTLLFDSPKCLFRWLTSPAGHGATGAYITEYFTRERTLVDDALYVLGSDIEGPMGRDLVPVAPRERAEHFASAHGGRVLSRAEVTADVVEGLFR